jgi:ABC-type Fe3+/spermidine/putrescine transport system ATPase subunit
MTKAYFLFARQRQPEVAFPASMSLIITNLSKRYNDRWILREAGLQIERGKVFVLMGAPAAGKTTFLRLVSGREQQDAGQIVFNGEAFDSCSSRERGFHFPALDNASIWKKLFKSMQRSEISESEGQLLALQAALQEADSLLLLDNSFCILLENVKEKAVQLLKKTAREKQLCVVLATNDTEEAFLLADRVGILHNGSIIQTGTPREIYENPESVAAACALGRCNLIQARRVSFTNQTSPEFKTLRGDHRLHARQTDRGALGAITDDVTLVIRPEHISLSFGAAFPEDNLIKAVVDEIAYLGATTRVFLDAEGQRLEALVLRLVGLNIGDECLVGLPPERIHVLKS